MTKVKICIITLIGSVLLSLITYFFMDSYKKIKIINKKADQIISNVNNINSTVNTEEPTLSKDKANYYYVGDNMGLIMFDRYHIFVNSQDTIITPWMIEEGGKWEPMQTYIFQNLVKDAQVFLDIGSHIGYYTVIAGRHAPEAAIYAFEANPDLIKLISKNIEANNCNKRVKMFNSIVSDHVGSVDFAVSSRNLGLSKVLFNEDKDPLWINEDYKVIKLPTIKLDDVITTQSVDMIRMDIEGSEFVALDGAKEILKRSPNVIIMMEANKSLMLEVNKTVENITAKIKPYLDDGFKLWVIMHRDDKDYYLMPIATAEEFANNDYGDVVMSKRDLLKEFPQLKDKSQL